MLMKAPLAGIAAVFAMAGSLFTASAAVAEVVHFKVELKGTNEVPPNNSPGTGLADVTFDTASKALSWVVTYAGLTGPAIGAHMHGPTDSGSNAGILVPFRSVASPIEGSTTLTDSQASGLMSGQWYVNIHTEAHPGGELRGQLVR
jgi:hypothetical protein